MEKECFYSCFLLVTETLKHTQSAVLIVRMILFHCIQDNSAYVFQTGYCQYVLNCHLLNRW